MQQRMRGAGYVSNCPLAPIQFIPSPLTDINTDATKLLMIPLASFSRALRRLQIHPLPRPSRAPSQTHPRNDDDWTPNPVKQTCNRRRASLVHQGGPLPD